MQVFEYDTGPASITSNALPGGTASWLSVALRNGSSLRQFPDLTVPLRFQETRLADQPGRPGGRQFAGGQHHVVGEIIAPTRIIRRCGSDPRQDGDGLTIQIGATVHENDRVLRELGMVRGIDGFVHAQFLQQPLEPFRQAARACHRAESRRANIQATFCRGVKQLVSHDGSFPLPMPVANRGW
ncbi:hypothetical protein HRbin36_01105 [bacterium HR36]|nr:hypothetical protein HRbin36_01105 [bacterium HR36]